MAFARSEHMNYSLSLIILFISTTFQTIISAQEPKTIKDTADTHALLPNQVSSSLKSVFDFPVGAAVNANLLRKRAIYRETVAREFNSITAENAMKFGALHPSETEFRFKAADGIVAFAQQHNMRVHGHTLLWPQKVPDWIKNYKGDRKAWENLLRTHIHTVVNHFKGKVVSWDVVNEAVAESGALKKSIWLDKLGPDYIAMAFRFAHEADPNALLFYNDYGHEFGGKKLQKILAMVQDFKQRGVPIHGLGMQMHLVVRISDQKIKNAINSAARTGLLVHISELEISVKYNKPKTFLMDDLLASQQAQKYKAVFLAYRNVPKKQQFGITTWNVGDADAFRNNKIKNRDHPMLFDVEYKPKAAYRALLEAAGR